MQRLPSSTILSVALGWATRIGGLGLGMLVSSCVLDREFEQGLDESQSGQKNNEVEVTSQESDDPADQMVTGAHDQAEVQPSGQSPTSPDQSPQNNLPTAQDFRKTLAEMLQNYCEAGSVSCYLMNEIDQGILEDHGSSELQIESKKCEVVSPKLSSYLFGSALQVVPGKDVDRPESIEVFQLPETGIIGFDVWLKPNADNPTPRWNAVALDGFLSLQTVDSNVLACKYNVAINPTFFFIPRPELLKVTVEFPKDEFVHVACAYDGTNVSLWVNGTEYKGPRHDRVIIPDASRYLLHWSSLNQTPFDGQLGPLRFWHDIPAMREEIQKFHQVLSALN